MQFARTRCNKNHNQLLIAKPESFQTKETWLEYRLKKGFSTAST
jgi:hypothetical protein